MKLAVSVALALSLGPLAASQVIHVPGDYPDVQAAINGASAGDVIIVQLATTGPLVVDKPLTIVGDPLLKLYDGTELSGGCFVVPWKNPVTLSGPGSGVVTLVNVLADNLPVPNCPVTPAPIVGSGFDELRILRSELRAPEAGLTGGGKGAPAIKVDVPLVTVEESTVVGGNDDDKSAPCSVLAYSVAGYPGIDNAGGSVLVLDSVVRGGDGGLTCLASPTCPPPPGGSGKGPGGPGVRAASLFAANSTIAGGIGSTLTLAPGGPGAVVCGKDPDGLAAEVAQLVLLPGILQGSSVMHLGGTWSLTYLASGPLATLFFSLSASAPYFITGAGWVFLQPGTIVNLGPVPAGLPQTLTFPIPLEPLLAGMQPIFQLIDSGQGLTRPVSSLILP